MAIALDTTIPSSLIFSHNIPNLTFSTDEASISLSIFHATGDFEDVFTTTLYPVDGKVTAYDIREVMEQYMRTNKLSFCHFRIEAENDDGSIVCSNDLKVLYCTFNPGTTDAAHFARHNFLTTQRTKEVDLSVVSEDQLCYYAAAGEDVRTRIRVLYEHDGLSTTEFLNGNTAAQDGIVRQTINFKGLFTTEVTLLSITVCVGTSRMFTYYFTKTPPQEQFFFSNAFNIMELMTLDGKTTKKFTSQRSEAVCGGRSVFYDLRNEMAFEFETVRLRKETAETLMQMFISPEIYKDADLLKGVVVKDFSYEIADDDSEKRIVKFTWKYADNRLLVDHNYNTNGKSFTTEFNDIYE